MAQINVNPVPQAMPTPALDVRRKTGLPEEPTSQPMVHSTGSHPIVLNVGNREVVVDGRAQKVEGGVPDGIRVLAAFQHLDPADVSVWEDAWTTPFTAIESTKSGGLHFELELRAWGRLAIGCTPLHPRGWHVSIASDDVDVRRRLRGETHRLGAALRQLAGHDDMTLEIDA